MNFCLWPKFPLPFGWAWGAGPLDFDAGLALTFVGAYLFRPGLGVLSRFLRHQSGTEA